MKSLTNKLLTAVSLMALGLSQSGCAPQLGGSDYSLADVGTPSQSLPGYITNVRVININAADRSKPGVGAGVGAVSGAVLGSTVGKGRGSTVAALVGGLAGGVGGHFAEQALLNQQGFEYTVQLDRGDIMTVAQGAEPKLSNGQRVAVVVNQKSAYNAARSRVIPFNG